ncbi:MAG: response regulator [Verrucomicrobiota bacterium]
MRILIVDDEPDICAYFCVLLRGRGYVVMTAQSEAEALQILRESRVDLVLLDVALGETSGLDALATIKARYARLPVVLMLGKTQEPSEYAGAVGAAGCFRKTLPPKQLLLEIDLLMAAQTTQSEPRR